VIAGGERRSLVTEVYTAVETTIASGGQRRQEFGAGVRSPRLPHF